ncbi:hypothetical protein K438DRAFT_1930688 [Mycena galopus ATCC 62051]|nr:hypothetical protein K438DRAFT_1930688 [Mycena galopus ATCC 62051]
MTTVVETQPSEEISAPSGMTFMPGMERGYALSPMADIHREYLSETEEEESVFTRMLILTGKKTLGPSNIVDRGISTSKPQPRFSISPLFVIRITAAIGDMQEIIRRAASLLPGRSSWFIIDPHNATKGCYYNVLYPALAGGYIVTWPRLGCAAKPCP